VWGILVSMDESNMSLWLKKRGSNAREKGKGNQNEVELRDRKEYETS